MFIVLFMVVVNAKIFETLPSMIIVVVVGFFLNLFIYFRIKRVV